MPSSYIFFPKIFRKSTLTPPFHKIVKINAKNGIPHKKTCIPDVFKIVSTPTIAFMGSKKVYLTLDRKTGNYEKRSKMGLSGANNDFK